MENNKPLDEREPTPYPKDNEFNNFSEIGTLNSVIVPPLKKALELVNLEINDKIEAEPEPEPEPIEEPKFSIVPSLMEAENLLKERELTPFQRPTPFEESVRYDSYRPQKEIIIEEYIIKKPSMPLLEEESMTNSMELIPNVRRSRKSKSKSKSKSVSSPSSIERTRKYKRCKRNHRRSKKTHHCNKHCPPGHRKNPITKSCRTTIKN